MSVRPPGKERFVRLKSLGEQYDWPSIQRRIFSQKTIKVLPEPRRAAQTRSYRLKGTLPRKKISGYRALYYHYLYKMGILPKHRASAERVPFALREDIYKLERINAETKLLCMHRIDTELSSLQLISLQSRPGWISSQTSVNLFEVAPVPVMMIYLLHRSGNKRRNSAYSSLCCARRSSCAKASGRARWKYHKNLGRQNRRNSNMKRRC